MPRDGDSTAPPKRRPQDDSSGATMYGTGDLVPTVVVAYCRHEPKRAGESAGFPDGDVARIFGRGGDGGAPRVEFCKQRPGTRTGAGPFERPKELSRDQLRFKRIPIGLVVENIGAAEVLVNGVRLAHGASHPLVRGDRVRIGKELLFLVTMRPLEMPALRDFPAIMLGHFGLPDGLGILGESLGIWDLRDQVAFVAPSMRHVLLLGESGTGKELVARGVHKLSRRAKGPFVKRNATTFPSTLIDSELFGNVRGYPNPESLERPGLIGAANGGTLFLDEMGDLPADLQSHLLSVLDEGGGYQRLGDHRALKSDFRLVGATNRPESAIKDDVRERLGLTVELPPLRARRDDIPLLVPHLLRVAAEKNPDLAKYFVEEQPDGTLRPRVSITLLDALLGAELPGNVRELDRLLWEAAQHGSGRVVARLHEAKVAMRRGKEAPTEEAAERKEPTADEVKGALERSGGVKAKACKELGIDRWRLDRLRHRYGLDEDGE